MWLLWVIHKYHGLKRWFVIAHYTTAPGWDYIKPDLYQTRIGWFQRSERGKWFYIKNIRFDAVIWRLKHDGARTARA